MDIDIPEEKWISRLNNAFVLFLELNIKRPNSTEIYMDFIDSFLE